MIKNKSYLVDGVNKRRLVIDYVPTFDLVPNEYNPNSHGTGSFDLLIRSISLFGFTQPIVADKKSMRIIDGEHRWRAACVLDIKEVPVCYIELTEEQMRLATIMHNKARGNHNTHAIKEIDKYLSDRGVNLDDELLSNHENDV